MIKYNRNFIILLIIYPSIFVQIWNRTFIQSLNTQKIQNIECIWSDQIFSSQSNAFIKSQKNTTKKTFSRGKNIYWKPNITALRSYVLWNRISSRHSMCSTFTGHTAYYRSLTLYILVVFVLFNKYSLPSGGMWWYLVKVCFVATERCWYRPDLDPVFSKGSNEQNRIHGQCEKSI